MAKKDKSLEGFRTQIDEVDTQLLDLLSQRIRLVQEVGKIKHSSQDAVYRPEREATLFHALYQRNPGPLSDDRVGAIFREIISSSYAHERPLKIAALGPEGTYSQAAVRRQFGTGVTELLQNSIEEVFREVESHSSDYGLVPVENSQEGAVTSTLDRFVSSNLRICGEIILPVHHLLLATPGTELSDIKVVYGHPQALQQCRRWLQANLPNCVQVASGSTGHAAQSALGEKGAASVGGTLVCELHDLQQLVANIEDQAGNRTRFLVIGHQDIPPGESNKTSIWMQTSDDPGGLMACLEPLHRRGINMTRIESRPAQNNQWHYVFFIDCIGHYQDEPVRAALDEIEKLAKSLRWLGSYPAAVQPSEI